MKMGMVRQQVLFAAVAFSLAGAAFASMPRAVSAETIGSVRGTAFWDKNNNGRLDAGETPVYGWYKITDGGSWFVCGSVGDDGSYGVPVTSGAYYVIPVAPKGYRATTPVLKTMVSDGVASLGNDIGFTADPTAQGESCDQYSPAHNYLPSIVEIAVSNGNFNTLVAAVKAAGLVGTLSGPGPFTVFAPTDAAFAKLPAGAVESLIKDPKTLAKILTYHVVSGKVLAADVVKLISAKTVEGSDVKISVKDGKVYINDAQVIITDIMASNGVIHVIDTVILPPGK